MRRSDREITNQEEMIRIMEKCEVCRLALHDDAYPYILPLNFGMRTEGGTVSLYFHGATEGKKYELIKKDNRASFEMDCSHQLVLDEEDGNCTMNYESVIGYGRIRILTEREKQDALSVLMKHYHSEDFSYNQAVVPQTTVFQLTVEHMSGKKRMKNREANTYES